MARPGENEDLLWRFWLGETDERENAVVEKLLAENKDVAEEYSRLIRVWQYSKYAGKWECIDLEKAWQKIEIKYNRQKKNFRVYYLAAASVVLIFGLGLLLFYSSFHTDPSKTVLTEVVPGVAKAQLILASGEKIDLVQFPSDKITEQGVVIDRDTSLLKYEAQSAETVHSPVYNELVIPRGGEYRVQLSDGTQVHLNADSRLKYPVAFTGTCRKVWLEGEAYFEVTADRSHPFVVETASVDVKVLGTGFNVMAYRQDERTEVTLVHGEVDVKTACGNTCLHPNQQLVFHDTDKAQWVREVHVHTYISWKEGILSFDGMILRELTERLSRWYDVDFFFASEQLGQLKFSGAFKKYDHIQYVLSLIEQTTDVKFVLKERTVVVYKK